MQWKTVIVNDTNWALATSEIKSVLHWTIQDKPWLYVKTIQLPVESISFPCQLKSLNWTQSEVNESVKPSELIIGSSLLMRGRVGIFTELYYRLEATKKNQLIDNPDSTILMLYKYLINKEILPGQSDPCDGIDFENRIKFISDLENIKKQMFDLVLAAKSKKDFEEASTMMDRLFFKNILL